MGSEWSLLGMVRSGEACMWWGGEEGMSMGKEWGRAVGREG